MAGEKSKPAAFKTEGTRHPAGTWGTRTKHHNRLPSLRFDSATRRLTIDFAAVADAKDQNEYAGVFDLGDEAVVTHAVFPELAKLGAVQRLADAARIFERREALVEKLEDALALLGIEFFDLAGSGGG